MDARDVDETPAVTLMQRWAVLRERARRRFDVDVTEAPALFDIGFRAGWTLGIQVGYFDGTGRPNISDAIIAGGDATIH